jgi:hypothetical protein
MITYAWMILIATVNRPCNSVAAGTVTHLTFYCDRCYSPTFPSRSGEDPDSGGAAYP